jgi:hypothetical protein
MLARQLAGTRIKQTNVFRVPNRRCTH